MNFKFLNYLFLLIFFLTGCSTAKVISTWKDETSIKKINSCLIVGVAIRKNRRQLFETTLANKLETLGIKATPSFTVFPKEEMNDIATSEYINQNNIDSVIVVKVLNSKAIKKRVAHTTLHTSSYPPQGVPTYYRQFNGWYSDYTYWTTTVGTYDTGYVVSNLEASIYQHGKNNVVWTSYVQIEAYDDDNSAVNDLSKALVRHMKKSGLI